MSFKKIAQEFGLSQSYFWVIKKTNIDAFNWYFSFDKDKRLSYIKAKELSINTRIELQDIIINMKLNEINKFSKYLSKVGAYKHYTSFLQEANKKFMIQTNGYYRSYIYDKKIIEKYKDFKNESKTNK